MTMDYSGYLLRTQSQILSFRQRYSAYISRQGDAFVAWICRLSSEDWTDFLNGVPEQNIPIVIGVICILFIDKRINIQFNETATRIRRNCTAEEFMRLLEPIKTPKPKNEK